MNGKNNLAESYRDSLDGKRKWLTIYGEETGIEVDKTSCPCCGLSEIDKNFITLLWEYILEIERKYGDTEIIITSGCRCEKYNKKIGGSYNSAHLPVALACDLTLKNIDIYTIIDMAKMAKKYFNGIGLYEKLFLHVDTKKRKYDKIYWVKNKTGYKYFTSFNDAEKYFKNILKGGQAI